MANKGSKTDFTFTYKQNSKTQDYLDNFESIRKSNEIENRYVTTTKGGKTTYRLKGDCQ